MNYLTRTIWILSLVSLFTDISSEMLYPVMPLFLSSIGFSSVWIGLLEGMAEATAGLSKGYFGRLSDLTGKRAPFVQLGYLLSAFSKPLMAVFTYPIWIFGARTLDRLGKGLRTGARDAILSDECTPQNKAKVFGFHRGMDTLGAAIGPALALLFLMFYPAQYKILFLLAFIPGLTGTILTLFIKEKKHEPTKNKITFKLSQTFSYLQKAPVAYKNLIAVLLLFALFNSSDMFLLMRMKQCGWNDTYIISAYILYNLVMALAAFPFGHLADKYGMKKTLIFSFTLFALVYAGFGMNTSIEGFMMLFILYGISAASGEGIAKALVSNMVPRTDTASAIGTFAGLNSLMALLASTLAGLIWKFISPDAVFIVSAAGVCLATLLLLLVSDLQQE